MLMYSRTQKKKHIKAILLLCIFAAAVIFLSIRVYTIATTVSCAQTKYMATMTINSVASKYLAENEGLYDDIIIKDKDPNGNITAINTDIAKINSLQTQIAESVLKELENSELSYVKLPILNILGLNILSDFGPKIPVKMMPVSNASVRFDDTFVSAGINQTKFCVNLNIEIDLMVLAEPVKNTITVTHTMPVAQIVLLGNVPGSYASITRK